jgi:hypothetical protein
MDKVCKHCNKKESEHGFTSVADYGMDMNFKWCNRFDLDTSTFEAIEEETDFVEPPIFYHEVDKIYVPRNNMRNLDVLTRHLFGE